MSDFYETWNLSISTQNLAKQKFWQNKILGGKFWEKNFNQKKFLAKKNFRQKKLNYFEPKKTLPPQKIGGKFGGKKCEQNFFWAKHKFWPKYFLFGKN